MKIRFSGKNIGRLTAFVICLAMVFTFTGCKKDPTTTESWLSYYEYEDVDGTTGQAGTQSGGDTQSGGGTQSGSGTQSGGGKQSGSGKQSGNGTQSGSGTQSGGSTSTKGTVLKRDNYTIQSGAYPIVTEGEATLHVMMDYVGDVYDTAASDFAKQMEKKTGVKVKYSTYGRGDVFTVAQTLINSGNTPDIFLFTSVGISQANIQKYVNDGLMTELTPYLETWGYNLKKCTDEFMYTKDGKVYAFPGVTKTGTKSEGGVSESSWYVNKKWCEELGMDVPDTTDELTEFFNRCVNNDPDGNGKNDTYGLGLKLWTPEIFQPWGLTTSYYTSGCIDESGNVKYAYLTDEYRNAILWYKDLYDRGLMCKDMIGVSSAATINKYAQKCGAVTGLFLNPTQFTSESKFDDWVVVRPKATNSGKFKAAGRDPGATSTYAGSPNNGVIFSSCKDPELAVRWMDYFYTEEGSMLRMYGTEGKAYKKVSGGYQLFKNVETLREGSYSGAASFPGLTPNIIQRSTSDMTVTERAMAKYTTQDKAEHITSKYSFSVLANSLTIDESQQLSGLNLPKVAWGFQAIRGEVNINTEWNSYVSKYSAAVATWEKIYNQVFKRVYG